MRHLVLLVLLAVPPLAAQETAASLPSPCDSLVGTWIARGNGFSTTLSYTWGMPGRMLEARNEVVGSNGRVIAQYRGAYVRHPDGQEWHVVVVGASGELHLGRAWWRDGVLWSEAAVTGGGTTGYASAIRLASDTMRYFARYTPGAADSALLGTDPLLYVRSPDPVAERRP